MGSQVFEHSTMPHLVFIFTQTLCRCLAYVSRCTDISAQQMMIEDNEEDLYTYFEEYVEMSGDDIHAKLRFEAFKKFAKYVCLSVRLFVTVIGCERVFVYAFACI
jgi:hypothetical protein